jgi:HD-GYP domain-containing protein (c-di-GMP phosphodiesterase class II)
LDQLNHPGVNGLVFTSRDITDRKRIQADLLKANTELGEAYDATIEGWSRALDLRDKVTEGHTQRVTNMTLRLAKILKYDESEIVHMRRGSLLHDIGKMGLPDQILQKAGPLTDEEWVEMRKHPIHAYNMLAPISYLHHALDIPYCHHERWDGSGYPRQLSKEKIPFSARIFSIVDVYDALSSDRPYRKKISRYIHECSGINFEPALTKIFLDHIDQIDPPDETLN